MSALLLTVLALVGADARRAAGAEFGAKQTTPGGSSLSNGSGPRLTRYNEPCFRIRRKQRCFLKLGSANLGMGCAVADGKYVCQAAQALVRAKPEMIVKGELRGGKNPGTVLCEKVGGIILLGNDAMGNQETFCGFNDDSLVTATSLWLWAQNGPDAELKE